MAAVAGGNAADGFSVAAALLMFLLAAWAVHPLLGLHLTVFATLVADSVTLVWYPMIKNFSSRESILFVYDRLTFSPIDVTLGFAMACLLVRRIATGQPLVRGPLLRPLLTFTGFVLFGFVYGLARGGDSRVAVFEVRPLLYLPMVYLLASNICRDARQFRQLWWTAIAAIFCQSLASLNYYTKLGDDTKATMESLGEHGAAVGMSLLLVLLIAWSAFRGCSKRGRLALVVMTIPVGWVFFLSNRRAAVVGLLAGVIMLSVILFWRQPKTFWKFAPVAALVLVVYTALFWNSTSTGGFPAQAIKSAVAPGSVSTRDQNSDIYRQLENKDLNFTIRQSKLLGTGFGKPFLQPFGLPDISSNFEFHNYIPHNSILWIWLQTGFFGFVAMFYLFARSLMIGAAKIRSLRDGPEVVVVGMAAIFITMYAVFAYVDIAWDARNMVLLGMAFATIAHYPSHRGAGSGDAIREGGASEGMLTARAPM
ncbi:MAG TPA: O-antigen ligase family protein [Ilumatobacteraceae bacterium]|nr:O-antigen ligase family protein [Ilumatobacteraceae bacterium]